MQSKSKREPLHADDVNALIRAYQLRDDADYLPFRGEAVACFFELLSARAKIAELEQAQERAYQMLEVNGVPRKRAKSVSNGIGVLATRLDRQEQASVPTRNERCPHGDNGDCWRCATSPPTDELPESLRDPMRVLERGRVLNLGVRGVSRMAEWVQGGFQQDLIASLQDLQKRRAAEPVTTQECGNSATNE